MTAAHVQRCMEESEREAALLMGVAEDLEREAECVRTAAHIRISELHAQADDHKRKAQLIRTPPEFLEGGIFGGPTG